MDSATLIDLIESAGYAAQSYSGRGMFGDSCVGFVCEGSILGVVAELLDVIDTMPDFEDMYCSFAAALRNAKYDNMGLDMIIYFPRVKWVEED